MKLRLSRLITLFLIPLLVACAKEQPGKEAYDSSFVLDSRLFNVDAKGGAFSMNYSIEGPREGNKAEVSTNVSWIRIGKVYNSEFNFTIELNTTGKDRTGTISLSCKGTKSYTLHVSQSKETGGSQIYHRFAIDVSDVTTSSAKIRISPVDASIKYLYTVVSKKDYLEYGAREYIKKRVEQVLETAAIYGTPLDSFLNSGEFVNNNTSLADDTVYYVAVFDLSFSEKGDPTYSGEVELCEFRTAKASSVNMSFKLSMMGTILGVTPTSGESYICDVTTKEIWDSYDTPEELARDYISTMKAYGYLETFLFSGIKSLDFSDTVTIKGEEYVAYAVGYRMSSVDSGLTTNVEYIIFKY